ncbi:hypothetical protein AQJ64_42965 [Streptomyces griseoruber]|uniref:Uncharacterized protein n=1 Tax=Streptomyces griseoruber TaxID=1943 RepID=A0A117R7G0_9ACTN|nr:hypothetical protein AQJ64_42965 [Streptomyces griseoruber]
MVFVGDLAGVGDEGGRDGGDGRWGRFGGRFHGGPFRHRRRDRFGFFGRAVGEERAAEEGDCRPSCDEDAQPGRYGLQVEEAGGGDGGPERGGQRDEPRARQSTRSTWTRP